MILNCLVQNDNINNLNDRELASLWKVSNLIMFKCALDRVISRVSKKGPISQKRSNSTFLLHFL